MLYKLILVDDEIWVLRGLLKTIPWKELGLKWYTIPQTVKNQGGNINST